VAASRQSDLLSVRRPAWQRYGAAFGLSAVVIAGRGALDPVWGHSHNRHLVFLPTVMLVAWLGGWGPGAVSAVMTSLALGVFWSGPHGLIEVALFLGVCLAMCALIESLHRARAREEEAKRAREHVLAIVAHDLRSPLSSIKIAGGSADRVVGNLAPSTASESLRRSLGTIRRAAARMDRLIGDLVDSTRIEQGKLVVDLRDQPLAPLLLEAAETFAPLASERGITLDAPPPAADVAVRADHDRLLQVLGNLVGNALRFTPEGGNIAIRAVGRDGDVYFEVADTGPGIGPGERAHIFERYGKSDRGGTGLGLFIARSIVRAHGGQLDFRSEPGAGATFFFTIPRATGVVSVAPSPPAA
jgi:signal transduction histidine kinase